MKFKALPTPTFPDTKLIQKFAWFPVRCGNEIRWLERVNIRQSLVYNTSSTFYEKSWTNQYFEDH